MTTQYIWEKYHQDIKQFVLSKVKDEHLANDLVQDIFIKIHTKLDTLKDKNKLKSWIFSTANYAVIDYFRSKKKPGEIYSPKEDTEDEQDEHHTRDCLYGIIKRLPKKYRDPLFLADIKGMKQADVAKQLKMQLPTTKSRIQRARKLIAEGYMACCDFKMNQKGLLVGEMKDKEDCKICS